MAKMSVCMAHLHGVGLGVFTYASAFDDWYPYRSVRTSGSPDDPTMLAALYMGPGYDDRPLFSPYMDLDQLCCPFSPAPQPLEVNPERGIHMSFEFWAGSPLVRYGSALIDRDNPTNLYKVGDEMNYQGDTFRVIAADFMFFSDYPLDGPPWFWRAAHPDKDGNGTLVSTTEPWTSAYWYGMEDGFGDFGGMDRNFLKTDGSVKTLYGLTRYDPRIVEVPRQSWNLNPGRWGYLLKE